ncbi:hypothetical protein DP761_22600, partial [Salmonella enterica subsp. enterica]|nr:hypothetical protein [Salmonella enterica subsp. enterica serovar Reading]MLO25780.1 hypothetical protein [Salmonella enterica subsp. enterica serovar Reading]
MANALVVIKDMYRKQSRKVPATAPLEFVPESWHKVVITALLQGLSMQRSLQQCPFSNQIFICSEAVITRNITI